MATKTARFEIINPYQKYGLKRRPTFNEILGLIEEDQQMLRPFPDRTATQFRNSPQGSFFDGADHIELLKEQQDPSVSSADAPNDVTKTIARKWSNISFRTTSRHLRG